ncbi:hypothetical protein [Microbacterium sulfonylureivorans]|uniref:hypothetical protein n=1 Tax=Microbacterium sulfonylureivorans TaxID=2486854 RepID=UPI000FDC11FB|nr:hypothetical protein [Microbacterium sulfonylureivorans]
MAATASRTHAGGHHLTTGTDGDALISLVDAIGADAPAFVCTAGAASALVARLAQDDGHGRASCSA